MCPPERGAGFSSSSRVSRVWSWSWWVSLLPLDWHVLAGDRARVVDLIAHYVVCAVWLAAVPAEVVHDDHKSISAYIAVSPNYTHSLFAAMMLSTALAGMNTGLELWRTRHHFHLPAVPAASASASSACPSTAVVSRGRRSSSAGVTPRRAMTRAHALLALVAPVVGSFFGLGLYVIPVCVQPWHNLATLGTFVMGTVVVLAHRARVQPSRATLIVWGLNLLAMLWDTCVAKVGTHFFLVAELVGFFSYRHFLVQSYVQTRTRLPTARAAVMLASGSFLMKQLNDVLRGEECLLNRAMWFTD